MIACVDTLIDGTAILSFSVKSLIDCTSGLRTLRYSGYVVIADMPLTWTLALVLSHSVISDGAPTEMNWMAPLMIPSFITLGPATLTQLTLISPSPSPFACFSTSLSRSITISGRKLTPYCCATLISPTSAVAEPAVAASRNTSTTRLIDTWRLLDSRFFLELCNQQ